jgi:hypothetical protein
MYIYFAYPAISKSPKHLPIILKITEASVVLIAFDGIICDISSSDLKILQWELSDRMNLIIYPAIVQF